MTAHMVPLTFPHTSCASSPVAVCNFIIARMSRHAFCFSVLILMLCSARASQLNVTVDDSDPSIVYAPPTAWNSSAVVCTSCDNPPVLLALQKTYHKGVHMAPPDADDSSTALPPPTSTQPTSSTHPPTSTQKSPPTPSPPPDDDDPKIPPGTPDDDNDADDHSNKKSPNRRAAHRFPRVDLDDPGSADQPVSAHFNFTGTAVYIFCIQPMGLSFPPAPPSLMNLTFLLDDGPTATFIHQGSASSVGFVPNVNVFAKQGLEDGLHVLTLNLAPNSVFVLDYLVVTKDVAAAETSDVSPTPSAAPHSQISTPTPTAGDRTTKSGRASFAGALAGSLGVLGIISFGTAFSLIRRRQRAARRDQLEGRTAPPMAGPDTFIPRYFPGTVVSSTPPPYAPSDASSSSSLAQEPLLLRAHGPTYADIPPPLDDLAPPPFGVALAAPTVHIVDVAHMVALPASRATSLFAVEDDDDRA
ncbi:hypothetical protein B0H17DRAFT_1332535 [Mycena rosella]|uniref:Transmembrane protein n=1 Tax=Mycena rosella TaxID=1033263 RepID=A0AAD7GBU0_MYCRO|nr:hypothetical protein B0H17DRAFT_1332535 [Mycena rosella]